MFLGYVKETVEDMLHGAWIVTVIFAALFLLVMMFFEADDGMMKERGIGLFKYWWARWRLWRIEGATHIKLTEVQKDIVLRPECDASMYGGRRGCGKTLTAVMWALVWGKKPIYVRQEESKVLAKGRRYAIKDTTPAIPDPDAVNIVALNSTLALYSRMSQDCNFAGVKVQPIIYK